MRKIVAQLPKVKLTASKRFSSTAVYLE